MTDNVLAGGDTPAAPTEAASTPVEANTETPTPEAGAAPSEPVTPDASDDAKEDKPRKSRVPERIKELMRDRSNLRRTVARLHQQIGQLRAEAPPKLEDFPDEQEFTRANFKRATREAGLEQQVELLRSEEETLNAKRQEAWADTLAEARQRMPDIDSVFDHSVPVSEAMAELIMEADDPAALAYWLGKNRGEARRMFQMQPVEVARELGRLEARLTASKPKTVSSAPKPVETVRGGAAPSSRELHELAKAEDATEFIRESRRRAAARGD